MKALVTGGAGFIGSNIVKQLLLEGQEVTVLDNLSSGYWQNLEPYPQIRFIEGDIRDPQAVSEAVQGAEVIYHLAASVGNKRSIDHPLIDAQINVLGTLQVLEAARRAGIGKVVISSSAGTYGELKFLPIKEDHPAEPDSPYGSTKLCAEKLGLSYAKLHGMEVICLRYFNVYGVNQRYDAYGNVIPIFAYQMLRGERVTIFGDGEQTRDFVNVRDVVQANLKAGAAQGVYGAFNIASSTQITINRLVQLLAEASGITPDVVYGPPRPGDVRHSLADIGAASDRLGYRPAVDLAHGLAEYMAWVSTEVVKV